MADQDRRFAQVVRLTPPPTYRQFATERVRARIKERKAGKTLREALDRRAEADEQGRGRVNPVEVARVWNLTTLRDLRADLPPSEQESFVPCWRPFYPARRSSRSGIRPLTPSLPCVACPSPQSERRANGGKRGPQTRNGKERKLVSQE